MVNSQLRCLIALGQEQHLGRAAQASQVSQLELSEAIRQLEHEYGRPLIKPGPRFEGFTPQGEQVLAWARNFLRDSEALRRDLLAGRNESAIAPLLERRSVSPKRLRAPGPGPEHIDLILQALRRAREHATRPPVLLAFVVTPRARSKVPAREQWLAAGAALGNLLNAAHQLGFGAIMLSGERCFDPVLSAELGVKPEEFLAGFVSLGSVAEVPPARSHALPGQVWSAWMPQPTQETRDAPTRPPVAPLNLDIADDKT